MITKKFIHFLATGFYSGLLPKAPGTFGTIVAIPIFLLLTYCGEIIYLFALVLMIIAGGYLCGIAARDFQQHDDPRIVWDEICGYLTAMYMVPPRLIFIILGFFLFRLLDILKPWPIKMLDQHIKGGFGIMVDDLVAGIGVLLILQLLIHYVI